MYKNTNPQSKHVKLVFLPLDLSHFVFFYLVAFFKQKQTVQPVYHALTTTFSIYFFYKR